MNTYKYMYELWDYYESDDGQWLCSVFSIADLRAFAEQYKKDCDGECKLFVKVFKIKTEENRRPVGSE